MRRRIGLLGLGALVAIALLSLATEQLQPLAVTAAAASLATVAGSAVVSRRVLSLLAIDVLVVFVYLWTLGESLHIVVHAQGARYVVAVGGRSATFPATGGGRIGLYAGPANAYPVSALGDAPTPSSGPLPALADALRFAAPGPAWAHVRLSVTGGSGGGPVLFRMPASGWGTNARGELAGDAGSGPILSVNAYTRYTLSADLMRPGGTQGVLVGVGRGGSGYLLLVRMDDEAASWERWQNGTAILLGGAPFKVDVVGMVQRALRAVLPSALLALVLVTVAAVLPLAWRFGIPPSRAPGQLSWGVPPWLIDATAGLLAIAAGAGAATIATELFARAPNVQDAVAYLFQAKTFALGRLWVPAPTLPSFFRVEFIPMYHGHWFGKYPPGWPLLLAVGVLLGQPWLVNPLLVGADLLLLYWIGWMAYGRGVALIATLLAATSPMLLFIGASFMAHAATLFYAGGFVALVLKWEVGHGPGDAGQNLNRRDALLLVGAGFLIGMAFMTRELDALALALPFAALFLRRPYAGACVVAGGAVPGALWLLYNRALTGSLTTTPYTLWWSFDRIGFGPSIGGPEPGRRGFTFAQGLWNLGTDLQSLQAHLFGWPFYLALALAAVPFLVGRIERWDVIFAASAFSMAAAYVFYFNPGLWYGPRYYYVVIPWLALLSARGFIELYRLGARRFHGDSGRPVAAAAFPVLLGAALVAYDVGFYIPAQLPTYRIWNESSARTADALRSTHLRQGLVFVAGPESVYDVAFSLNSPLLSGRIVYARDEGSRDRALASRYPGKPLWRFRAGRLRPLQGEADPARWRTGGSEHLRRALPCSCARDAE